MAIPSEKLAESLDVLRQLQESKNSPVIRSSEISRTHYERLVKNGFLMKVVGGWYIQSDPAAVSGDTTAWYISYWRFISEYIREKLGRVVSASRSFIGCSDRQLDSPSPIDYTLAEMQ